MYSVFFYRTLSPNLYIARVKYTLLELRNHSGPLHLLRVEECCKEQHECEALLGFKHLFGVESLNP